MDFCVFLPVAMARDKKPVRLRPVDGNIAKPAPIRLKNPQSEVRPQQASTIRLDLPSKEFELRTHQPGIDVIIDPAAATPEVLEQSWGEASTVRNPLPWGWFVLIGLAITAAVVWSLSRVTQADRQADEIRNATATSLVKEALEEQQAAVLIDRINQSLKEFFNTTTVDERARWVRQPERVVPLMRKYYPPDTRFSDRLTSISLLHPLTLDHSGNFWRTTVELANQQTDHLILEILESGEVRFDWESMVCYQPMKWDDYVAQRPVGAAVDFRVFVEPADFYSHDFADPRRWVCYRLTALNNVETLFGYAAVGSEEAKALQTLFKEDPTHKATLVLRLGIPAGLQSRRGVVIQKILSNHWVFITPPPPAS